MPESSMATIASKIGSAGPVVNKLLNLHGGSYPAIEAQLQNIVHGMDSQTVVATAADVITKLPNVPVAVANIAAEIKQLTEVEADQYNSTSVLLLVSKAHSFMAQANTNILSWLTSLNTGG